VSRRTESLFLAGPAGALEAQLELPAQPRADWVGLVCHPHPQHGGTMRNKVVQQAAKVLRQHDLPVLRFLKNEFPQAKICLGGFSFGAWVGLRVGCREAHVGLLLGIGLPADSADFSYLARCTKPKLFVQGTRDQFGSPAAVSAVVAAAAEPKRLLWVEGADHFFTRQLDKLAVVLAAHLPDYLVQG